MNLLSTGILVALLAVSAAGLALTLNEPARTPAHARINAVQPYLRQEMRPIPCPTKTPDASDPGAIDPGILAPTPATPFVSRMPAGGQPQCFSSVPAGR